MSSDSPTAIARPIRSRGGRRLWIFVGCWWLVVAGCGTSDPASPTDKRPSNDDATADLPTDSRANNSDETWDVIYMDESPIGYLHTRRAAFDDQGQGRVRTTGVMRAAMQRMGDKNSMEMTFETVETPTGDVQSFRSETRVGPSAITIVGTRAGDEMTLVTRSGERSATATMKWDDSYGGFFAVEQSLRDKPMRPGERRTVHELSASLSGVAVGKCQLAADTFEAVALPSGSQQLLKIHNSTTLNGQTTESLLWTDQNGLPRKSQIPSMHQTIVRTTKAAALESLESPTFDLAAASIVKVDRRLDHAHATQQITYLVTLEYDDPSRTFFDGIGQRVTAVDEHTAEIVVTAIRPDRPPTIDAGANAAPTKADRTASTLIQADDLRIVTMADQVAADESDAWTVAQALEQLVHRAIRIHNYSQAFASAADVAETLEGDCTEHAVLLAALCRAREIPARVATGLVYVDALGGFGFHMWTEVWIADRWIPIDGTLGLGGIGAAHLKLVHSSLADGADFDAFLPVAKALRQLKLKIVDVK